jgi:hypothetical protein
MAPTEVATFATQSWAPTFQKNGPIGPFGPQGRFYARLGRVSGPFMVKLAKKRPPSRFRWDLPFLVLAVVCNEHRGQRHRE